MSMTAEETSDGLLITITGSATIEESERAADLLRRAAEGALDRIFLSIGGITNVDVSFFQLLIAFRRQVAEGARRLSLDRLPADHVVVRTATLLGLANLLDLQPEGES